MIFLKHNCNLLILKMKFFTCVVVKDSREEFSGRGSGNWLVKQRGFEYAHVFSRTGTFYFECGNFSSSMQGIIRVFNLTEGRKYS